MRNTFSDKQKLIEFTAIKLILQKMLKDLHREGKSHRSETQIYINKGRASVIK